MQTIIIILLIAILSISIYQLYIIKKIKKTNGNPQLADPKYFELKYQTESYVKIFSILIALATYFGYSSFSKAKEDIEKAYVEPLDKYKSRLDSIDIVTKSNEEFIKKFNAEKEAIKSVLLKSGMDAKGIERDINLLAKSRINQLKIYVVPLKITSVPVRKVYFENCKTHDGKSLPKFTKPPFVQIQSNEIAFGVGTTNITTESFDIPNTIEEVGTFYLWILSEE